MSAPTVKFAQHADAGGSWYCPQTRRQVQEVTGANGKPRKPTLRDAREHGWVPGVTGIIRCAAAPGLERWKIGQAILAALTLPREPNEPDDAWIDRILEDGQETARKAAEAGTAIHAKVQQAFESSSGWDDPHVTAVRNALYNACGEGGWTPERMCFHPAGWATKADLAKNDGEWIVDMKSSEFDEAKIPDLRTYATHWMQLAATRAALACDDDRFLSARCGILYVSRDNPGLAALIDVKEPQLERGMAMFQALHRFWCCDRDYFPGRTEQ